MPENVKSPSEPSMEEIIASISRIITDEKTSVEPARPVPEEKSEILELTEIIDEDGSVRRIAPEAGSSERHPIGSAAAADPANATARSGPGALGPEAEVEPRLELGRERILSSTTSGAAAAAFVDRVNRRDPRGRDGRPVGRHPHPNQDVQSGPQYPGGAEPHLCRIFAVCDQFVRCDRSASC